MTTKVGVVAKIKFWDCYCVEVGEKMDATYDTPMKMKIRLSPAITENRGLKHEKTWKVTDLVSKPFKPEPQAPPTPLVKSVKGEETAVPDTELEYKVTDYNINVSKADKDRIQWKVKVGKEESLLPEKGEVIKLKIKQEWAGKEILVMPYLKTPTERVSVKTKVVCKHVNGALDVATYIVNEIKTNTKSPIAGSIRYFASYEEYEKRCEAWKKRNLLGQLLNSPEPPNLIQAKILWTTQVFSKRPWDHKPMIRDMFNQIAIERTEYSDKTHKMVTLKSYYHKYKNYDYYYDVWSNIHYGYVGLSVGFDEETLLNGADSAQIIDSLFRNTKDTVDDKISIKIGFSLYYKYGKYAENLTAQVILDALDAAIMTDSKKKHVCFEK